MKKILYIAIALACIVAFMAFNGSIQESVFKRVKRHDVWGPACRQKCADNKGEICGFVSQGCCTIERCSTGFTGQNCENNYKLHIPGCTTD
ncbi:unnamed protein product (macronuclear) [Paramecium tetraurelia]|uniref:EGF-like domain-containing protein n=1 Tax=Paramecium tetraurelia TaxID=5888 RepID=A0DKS4_PARTE|nr:uncharacterized protein GSPATT00017971001 [Paramecium tetraurelia]CAK83641.1 unnamed protein product [Paramecium tetraurelia]|eukprot:XP_001451038.1 hypothetical protein (macronuclear) [Paramecium tetraurelia strain d4-2]